MNYRIKNTASLNEENYEDSYLMVGCFTTSLTYRVADVAIGQSRQLPLPRISNLDCLK